jgi:aryl-alcohol dehydrogenase-like predicted oxidoreductase
MQYGSKEWLPSCEEDEEKIFSILKKAYDHGFRTYDTANVYSNGLSEILLGKFLKKYNIPRDRVVIMTKAFFPVDESKGPSFVAMFLDSMPQDVQVDLNNSKGLSRKHILDAIKGSMERLGTYIDVYQIHRLDKNVTKEEIMRTLNYCVDQGYTRYIGASAMKAVEFVQLQNIAEKNGWHKFINMQSCYNLLSREDEHELNYFCDDTGVGLTPYSPLSIGFLARPLARDSSELTVRAVALSTLGLSPITADNEEKAADSAIINRVQELSEKKNVKMFQIALAWLVARGTNPIVDISKMERFEDYLNASDVTLTPEEIAYLEEPYKPKLKTFL